MSVPVRSLLSVTLAALAALGLGACAAPYGYGGPGGYGGYAPYGSAGATGYANGYGGSTAGGTYVSQDGYASADGAQAGAYAPAEPAPAYPPAAYPPATYPGAAGQPPAYGQSGQQGSYGAPGYAQGAPAAPVAYGVRYGWVESIEQLPPQPAGTSGAGAVVGGLVGGLLGHQVGGGRGNTVATIGGAVVGALAGNEVEKRASTAPQAFRVRVRTSDNAYLTLTQSDAYRLRNGDRVRIENGVAVPY